MEIYDIQVKNFRCFENLKIKLHPKCTVIVGVNGAGKSTILDAIAIALGSYFSGFDSIASLNISKDDAHYNMYELGSAIEREPQYPVCISARGNVQGENIEWKKTLNSGNGRNTIADAKTIIDIAKEYQGRVREGDKALILPLVAYYGTGRLWMQKKEKRGNNTSFKFSRVSGYLTALESASNDKLMKKWFEKMTFIELQEGTKIPELSVVREALKKSYISVNQEADDANFFFNTKTHELEIKIILKNGEKETLPVRLLSDGIKGTLSMVADIAYRMAVLNPQLGEKILTTTEGVVLIDEVDMHLHPEWQRHIIKDLQEIFPQVQFVVTTHSPSVIANVKKDQIVIMENGEIYNPANTTYGRNVDSILREIMDVEVRPSEVLDLIRSFENSIDMQEYDKARSLLNQMEGILGKNDSDVVNAKITLELEEV